MKKVRLLREIIAMNDTMENTSQPILITIASLKFK